MKMKKKNDIVYDRIEKRLSEVNDVEESQLSGVYDHINFTLQKAYFKCAYECFNNRRKTEDDAVEITKCAKNCAAPVIDAHDLVKDEIDMFQEKLQSALKDCHRTYALGRLRLGQPNLIMELEVCANRAIDNNVKTLPNIVEKLKRSLGMNNSI